MHACTLYDLYILYSPATHEFSEYESKLMLKEIMTKVKAYSPNEQRSIILRIFCSLINGGRFCNCSLQQIQ